MLRYPAEVLDRSSSLQHQFGDHFAVSVHSDLAKSEARIKRSGDRVARHVADEDLADLGNDGADFVDDLVERGAAVSLALISAVDHEPIDQRFAWLIVRLARIIHQETDDAFAHIDHARARAWIGPCIVKRLSIAREQVCLGRVEFKADHRLPVVRRHVPEFDVFAHYAAPIRHYSAAIAMYSRLSASLRTS